MKRLLLKTGLIAVLGAGGLVFCLWWTTPSRGINRTIANRIRVDMTLQQVEAVIDLPAGDHRTKETEIPSTAGARFTHEIVDIFTTAGRSLRIKEWIGDEGVIVVAVDSDERTVRSVWIPFSDSFFDKLRSWLHLN